MVGLDISSEYTWINPRKFQPTEQTKSFLRRELSQRSADRGNKDKAPGIRRQEMETNVDNQSGNRDWVPEMD